MPNIKSAKKRVKVSIVRNLRNKSLKSSLRTCLKKADASAHAEGADKQEVLRVAVKKIDQAVAKGVLHKNTAARKKSQLARSFHEANA